jgi:hypothetical protein
MFYSTQKNKARRIISPTVFTQFNYMSSADDRLDYVDARSYTMWVEVWDHNMQKRLNCGYVANGNKVKCDSLWEQLIKYLPEEQWMQVWACRPGQQIDERQQVASFFREPYNPGGPILQARMNRWTELMFNQTPSLQLVIRRIPIQGEELQQGDAKRRLTERARVELTMANEYFVSNVSNMT